MQNNKNWQTSNETLTKKKTETDISCKSSPKIDDFVLEMRSSILMEKKTRKMPVNPF